MIEKVLEWLGTQTINFIVNGRIEIMWTWYF
jgi:hypothetical protein